MKVNRIFNPNYCMGPLNGNLEIIYRITECDYIMEKNIALVLDTSASMELVWLNEKEKRIEVLAACVETLLGRFYAPGTKVNIFICAENGKSLDLCTLDHHLHTHNFVAPALHLNAGGNTNLGDGMREAYWYLNNCPASSKKYMIILSDGETNSYTTIENTAQSNFKLDDGDSIYTFKGSRALEYAKKIASPIAEKGISTFAAALTANTPNQLEVIAAACNAMVLDNGKHYYQIRHADEIQAIYSKINDSFPQSIPVAVTFNEVFPYGVKVAGVPEGLKISQQSDNRYCVKGTLDTMFVKNDATGTYSFKPWEGTISLKFSSAGMKAFIGPCVSYIHPSGKFVTADLDNPLMYSVFC